MIAVFSFPSFWPAGSWRLDSQEKGDKAAKRAHTDSFGGDFEAYTFFIFGQTDSKEWSVATMYVFYDPPFLPIDEGPGMPSPGSFSGDLDFVLRDAS